MDVRKLLMKRFQQHDELQRGCEVSLLMSLVCAVLLRIQTKRCDWEVGTRDGARDQLTSCCAGADSLWLVGSVGDLIRCGGF
jgi:hypothetical protein